MHSFGETTDANKSCDEEHSNVKDTRIILEDSERAQLVVQRSHRRSRQVFVVLGHWAAKDLGGIGTLSFASPSRLDFVGINKEQLRKWSLLSFFEPITKHT
jgi:hypothetical protein